MNERADGQENSGGEKLWGIYHVDAEYSRHLEEPVRTVVTAVTKTAADEAGAELGFGDAEVRPVNAEEARRAQWLPQSRPSHRPKCGALMCDPYRRGRRAS